MARNRMIKPEFWEDEKVGMLSPMARLLFIAILNFADDEGFVRWNCAYLSTSAFPYDKLSENKIKKMMKELEKLQIVEVFETNFHFFIGKIKNFKKHQKIKNPGESKFLQEYESHLLKNQSKVKQSSGNDFGNDFGNHYGNVSPQRKLNEKKLKERENNARAREEKNPVDNSTGKEKENAGVAPPAPTFNPEKDQNGKTATTPNDTTEKPMPWNEQSKYAQSLGISLAMAEQIIHIAKENRILLFRAHWQCFSENQNLSAIIPMLKSLIDTKKKKSSSGMVRIGSG